MSSHETRSDHELLLAHAAGEPRVFDELIRRHQDYLWRVAQRGTYSYEDAGDALQEALLSAHRSAAKFRSTSSVRTWLHSIVVNACIDRLRWNQRHRLYQLIDDPEEDDKTEIEDPFTGFEEQFDINRALMTLPFDQRATVFLIDLEGYTIAEAAELLGVPTGTIKSRCARARGKLREYLEFLREPRNQM